MAREPRRALSQVKAGDALPVAGRDRNQPVSRPPPDRRVLRRPMVSGQGNDLWEPASPASAGCRGVIYRSGVRRQPARHEMALNSSGAVSRDDRWCLSRHCCRSAAENLGTRHSRIDRDACGRAVYADCLAKLVRFEILVGRFDYSRDEPSWPRLVLPGSASP
jgi:hypothetical protein